MTPNLIHPILILTLSSLALPAVALAQPSQPAVPPEVVEGNAPPPPSETNAPSEDEERATTNDGESSSAAESDHDEARATGDGLPASPSSPTAASPTAASPTAASPTAASPTALSLSPTPQPNVSQATDAATRAGQTDLFVESEVIALVGREGFRWQDPNGHFLLQPYFLIQTRFQTEIYDDEGLDLADPDRARNMGFGVSNAIVGFAGKAFEKLSYNVTLNGACAGKSCLLNQGWLEGNASRELRVRVGKFKTPMHWNVLSRSGQKLAPRGPASLSTPVNLPFDINANNPTMATGFDLGLMVHGFAGDVLQYQVGVFNGEGIAVNAPTSTLNDDNSVPGLLYSGRVAFMPLGQFAPAEGGWEVEDDTRLLVAASGSYNVEAASESSNESRAGFELAASSKGFYAAIEGYALHLDFVERQRAESSVLFLGGYAQIAYSLDFGLEPFVRGEVFDRNSTDEPGVLILPAVGLNYYMYKDNLKLQGLYQALLKAGHEDDFSANDDDNSMPEHAVIAQLQFSL